MVISNNKGMTLVEVILSMLILGIVTMMIFSFMDFGVTVAKVGSGYAKEQANLRLVAYRITDAARNSRTVSVSDASGADHTIQISGGKIVLDGTPLSDESISDVLFTIEHNSDGFLLLIDLNQGNRAALQTKVLLNNVTYADNGTSGDTLYFSNPESTLTTYQTVTISGGATSQSLSTSTYPAGTGIRLNIIPESGYGVESVTLSYTGYSEILSGSTFIMPSENVTLTIVYSIITAAENTAPVAANDTVAVEEDSISNTIDVLANDHDIDGDPLAIASVTPASHGSATNLGSMITYTPTSGYTGPDSFSYTIIDGRGGSDMATVSVTVNTAAPNHPPVAVNDNVTVVKNSASTINVLLNDTDADGDTLTIINVTAGGHGSTTTNGSTITYDPVNGYSGSDSFNYTISDGNGGTSTATVNVTVSN